TAAEHVQSYLKIAKKPTALRALISSQADDLDIGVFADQVLTAQSWYQGKNPLAAESAMADMVDQSLADEKNISKILENGAAKVQQTIQ
ncbi:MAG TPA: hypothetical protein VMD74_03860, partial [Candidatus Methylomirabilis sp.]|nr:hypothetical protein [Candidatus Methylomirabilis sp.]